MAIFWTTPRADRPYGLDAFDKLTLVLAVVLLALWGTFGLPQARAPLAPCTTDLDCACRFPDAPTPGVTDYAQGARDAVRAGLLTCLKGTK